MRTLIVAVLIVSLAIPTLASPVQAQRVTSDEAQIIANNWISLIIHAKGGWGGSPNAEVTGVQEFTRGERVIGYFCQVKPQGYIVISLYKGLAPVKAYSETSDLDPGSEEGMTDLIKLKMEGILDQIEQLVGPIDSASAEDLDRVLEVNYWPVWAELGIGTQTFRDRLQFGVVQANYQGGQVLLASNNWHQFPPYNDQCPNMGCSWPDYGNYNTNALVGCIAIAGAQTMRYWSWPPYRSDPSDTFDWPHMADSYWWCPMDNRWEDENGNPYTLTHINAVAELCHEVGVESGMDYGCSGSGAYLGGHAGEDLLDTFEDHFRYDTAADIVDRDDYSADEWWNEIVAQLNVNRPLPYGIEKHAIVCDGWQVVLDQKQYHMNYGWSGTGSDTWYALDELPLGGRDVEQMLIRVHPAQDLGHSLSGTYTLPSFPYRYFDRDATGDSATFEAGQYLQFLPNVEVTCTSTTGGSIRFLGTSSYNTRLFTRGDPSKGICIYNSAVKLDKDGSIKLP